MARILMGWELGANRGHLVRMLRYRDALAAAGHDIAFAVQRIDGIAAETGGADRVWQAPLWPRLLGWAASGGKPPTASMGDILAKMGVGDAGTLSALVRGWEHVFAAERPDIIIAEYAPAMLRAAEGRIPTIAIGIGFCLPPAGMPSFPSLNGQQPVFDERQTLSVVNAELARCGRSPLPGLPALFRADHVLVEALAELDPYAARRDVAPAPPMGDRPLPPLAPPEGDEIFVYWPERTVHAERVWEGLRRTGLPVRIHVARLDEDRAAQLRAMGFAVEPRPLPFADIARRSRLLLSHGGGGFVMNGMLSGRPQIVVHFDLEKRCNGAAVDRAGLGAQIPLGEFDVDVFARGIITVYRDAAMLRRAMAAARGLRARLSGSAEEEMVAAVAAILA